MGKRRNPRRSNRPATVGNLLNNATYLDYLARFRRIALSIFAWENLPSTMNARFLEQCLFEDGQASLLYEELFGGFLNTRITSAGYLNHYGLPIDVHCFSYGNIDITRKCFYGQNAETPDEYAVLVFNNWDRTPTLPTLELFAQRLTQAQRTADINISAQRTPIILLTDENQLLTVKNAYKQFEDNEPVIIGDKNILSGSEIQAIKTDAPFIADKIMDYKREIWNEFLTFLGINNLETEKKERLIESETASNNELVNMNLQAMLAPRQEACELFNKLFNLSGDKAIKVKVRSDLINYVKNYESAILGDENPLLVDNGIEEEK